MSPTVKDLHKARARKKNEFYTQYEDIEKEIECYNPRSFKGKVIYCPCDNPEWSNIYQYFKDWHDALGYKELIATYLAEDGESSYVTSYDGHDEVWKRLVGNGDFRSDECVEIMKQADIIITNPPFSLFRDFLGQIERCGKQFIILGTLNAMIMKLPFKMIFDKKMWLGDSIHTGGRAFRVPDDYPNEADTFFKGEDGFNYIRVKGVRWYTNIEYVRKTPVLIPTVTYVPENYQKLDNTDIICVPKTKNIPKDYYGVMAVPISYIDYHNPDLFEILGNTRYHNKDWTSEDISVINGKQMFCKLLIQRKTPLNLNKELGM